MNIENLQDPLAIRREPFPRAPWGLKDILFAIAVAAIGIVAVNLAIVGLSLVFRIPLRGDKDISSVVVALEDLVVVGSAWLFGIRRYHAGWREIGIRSFSAPLGCGLAVSLLIASYFIRIIYGLIALALGVQIPQQDILSRLDLTGWGFVATLVAAGIIAPVAEEIFFRGFLYGGLRGRMGIAGAMVVSTLFFTVLHLTLPLFIPIFVLGLFLAMLYEFTGSLYPGILLHSANNVLALLLLFVLQSMGISPIQ